MAYSTTSPPLSSAHQYLEIEEVLELLSTQASASIFAALPYAPLDTVHHRVWSVLKSDTRPPARNSFFSGSDIHRLLAGPIKTSVLGTLITTLSSSPPLLCWNGRRRPLRNWLSASFLNQKNPFDRLSIHLRDPQLRSPQALPPS